MYLHRLTLQAIGPYPDLVDIDFAALGASGVFLLEGPTGSGKSTIIDAVVYALYGKQASLESSDDRLYSQHAAAGTEPFVELVFETGAGVHRVRRTPPFDRPKQRGAGTTRQNSSAQLWRLADPGDAVGEALSARAQEVGAEVARIVGLDRAQFVQTVILPQGEFAKFLRSPGEDRRDLLQSIFGTEIYERTKDELVERRKVAAASVERADAAVRDALARFAQASGHDDADTDSAAALTDELVALSDAAETARVAAQTAAAAARATVADRERRTVALERRADLDRRSAVLRDSAERVTAARTRLDVAERSARVVGLLAGLDDAGRRLDGRRSARSALVERHSGVLAGFRAERVGAPTLDGLTDDAPVSPSIDALTERADRIRDGIAAARHLVPVEQSLPGRRAAYAESERTISALDARVSELDRLLAERPVGRADLMTASRTAREQAGDVGAAERAVADAEAVGRTMLERDAAATALDSVAEALRSATTTARAALAAETALRERRLAGLAGELGAALVADEPCPVCGSLDHPHVAMPSGDHPTPEAIESAAQDRADADSALSAVSAEHAVARGVLERLITALDGATPESVLAGVESARERLGAARAAAALVASTEAALVSFDAETRTIDADRADVVARVAGLRAAADAEQRAIAADAAAVSTATHELAELGAQEPSSLGLLVPSLDRDAVALTELATAERAVLIGEQDVADRTSELDRVVAELGFADAAAARAGALDPETATSLRAQVVAADRESTLVQAGFAEPDVVAAADDSADAIGLEAARVASAAADDALEAATGAAATSAGIAAATRACLAELDRAVAARESTSAESRAVVRLANIATAVPADNPTGITLGSYVLMRRFEDVLAAANSRLGGMLGGRFSLETSSEREAGARKTGLALAVRDHTTDRTRDPRSLSGGETFTASLCLALGLADVVQAEAGGVELGTLFVDEGFGTLDPETLDDVIGQLGRLTAGGRQVGIVSHVEELKQRIPDRIEVRRTAAGGSVVRTTV
jgi:DNA repair protein SbcC/Rad50